jgi:hypothetical protein
VTSKINQSATNYPTLIQQKDCTIRRICKPQLKRVCFFELQQHKTWLCEECSQFLDQREQAEMQWLQDPHQSNVGNLNNVGHEAGRHFRNKKKEYLKAKIDELETNS